MSGRIAVNARFRCHIANNPGGMARYAAQIHNHISEHLELLTPRRMKFGPSGHLWEQAVLPAIVGRRLLWSPSGTGPLAISHQVITIHDTIPVDHPEWFNSAYARWLKGSVATLARRAAHVITVSTFSKERIIATTGVDESKISVVLEGVDQQYRPQDPDDVAATRSLLGIPPNTRYVLYLGNIEPRKNVGRLLEAWRVAVKEVPEDVVLVVAGARGMWRVFGDVTLERIPNRVVFTGYVPDDRLPALYSGATAFVYPSLYEGFGLPTLEAMACGTPVVTSSTSSLPEVVGDAALMVDPLDVDDIAAALVRVVSEEHLRGRLVDAGFERAAQFTWERAATETLDLLHQFV